MRTTAWLLLAGGALAGLPAGGLAEERVLSEDDLKRIVPVLRAEGGVLAGSQDLSERLTALRRPFQGDPLAFLRARAAFEPPPAARYEATCSRAASLAGPKAVFSLGRKIDCLRLAMQRMGRGEQVTPDEACHAEAEKTDRFLAGVQAELVRAGFAVQEEGPAERWLEGGGGRLRALLRPYNPFDRANRSEDHPLHLYALAAAESGEPPAAGALDAALAACSAIPSGPVLVLSPGSRFEGGDPSAGLAEALRKAGLADADYQALKEALFMARADVEQDLLPVLEATAETEGARRELAVRRANAALFRGRAAELGPILDAMVPGGAGR